MKNICYLMLPLLLAFFSCKKTDPEKATPPGPDPIPKQTMDQYMTEFARTLARSLTDKEIRSILKQEALKMFDKDYDVLYEFSREVTGSNGKPLHEQLAAYASDKALFDEVTAQLPLLTIYIPELKTFDAKTWDIDKQTPIVAVRNVEEQKAGKPLRAYDAQGNEITLSYTTRPKQPVIIVKENERVIRESASGQNNGRKSNSTVFLRRAGGDYSFIDDSFNGLKPGQQTEQPEMPSENPGIATGRWGYLYNHSSVPAGTPLIDPRVITAFDKGIVPQRDYIYYGIDPDQGVHSGPLNTNYAEFVTGIYVNDPNSRDYIIDDYADGMLEFQVTVFFVQSGGVGGSIQKVFPVDPAKLFKWARGIDANYHWFSLEYTLPQPIPITDWNMHRYGNTWKVMAAEYDPGTETTHTTTLTTTIGTNYGFDVSIGTEVKLGLKYGITHTTMESGTITYKVSGTADNLGEGLLDYSAPILLEKGSRRETYKGLIYGVNTGTVTVDIETRKRY